MSQRGVLDLETRFLPKPFTPRGLISKVQEGLEEAGVGEAGSDEAGSGER